VACSDLSQDKIIDPSSWQAFHKPRLSTAIDPTQTIQTTGQPTLPSQQTNYPRTILTMPPHPHAQTAPYRHSPHEHPSSAFPPSVLLIPFIALPLFSLSSEHAKKWKPENKLTSTRFLLLVRISVHPQTCPDRSRIRIRIRISNKTPSSRHEDVLSARHHLRPSSDASLALFPPSVPFQQIDQLCLERLVSWVIFLNSTFVPSCFSGVRMRCGRSVRLLLADG